MKKMEFYEGEEQQKRVGAVMRALIGPKPSKDAKELPHVQSKTISENLDRA